MWSSKTVKITETKEWHAGHLWVFQITISVMACSTAQKQLRKIPLCMRLKLQVVIFNREMSDPHLSMLPIFDFIHEYQPIWICGLWPLQVDGIFFFCFPCYCSWNVICSLCKIFTSDVRTTPITETSARTGENKRFALFFRCRSIAVSAVQRPTAKCIGLLGRLAKSELLMARKLAQCKWLHQVGSLR